MTTFENTVRAAVRYLSAGTNLVNTMYFDKLGGFTETEGEELADVLDEWAASEVATTLYTGTTYEDTTVYDVRTLDSWLVYNDDNQGSPGTATGTPLALSAAMTVTFRTNRTGRSYRGRNYISGFAESQAGAKVFESATITAIQNNYEALTALVAAVGWRHVVASRVQGGVVLSAGVTTPVSAYRANARIYKMGERTR